MLNLYLLVLSLGMFSFGGGSALMAGLDRELVQTGRLAANDFAVAVALGQSTPGPLAAFTTAVGMSVSGFGGALAATAALMTVSLVAVWLIARIPAAWFHLPLVRAGLRAVAPVAAALAFYLAVRVLVVGSPSLLGGALTAGVALGRLRNWPTAPLILGAVGIGMLAIR